MTDNLTELDEIIDILFGAPVREDEKLLHQMNSGYRLEDYEAAKLINNYRLRLRSNVKEAKAAIQAYVARQCREAVERELQIISELYSDGYYSSFGESVDVYIKKRLAELQQEGE